MASQTFRTEKDSMGSMQVPLERPGGLRLGTQPVVFGTGDGDHR